MTQGMYPMPLPRRAWWLVLLALVGLGCATSPRDKVTQARLIYTVTLNTLSDLREAGRIDDQTYRRIELSRRLASAALEAADRAIASGQPGWKVWLDAAIEAVEEFAGWPRNLPNIPHPETRGT